MENLFFVFILIFIIIVIYFGYKIINSENYKALLRLCELDEEKINLYYDSYQKIFNDQKMISTLEDYNNNYPPSRFTIAEDRKISEYTAECYSVLNDLCTLGNVKKMYIPKMINSNKSLKENQNLYEKEVANKLNVSPGGKILELGCGCGRIAHHMSQETKCQVYGINIDEKQLNDAKGFAKQNKTNNEFIYSDYNDILPFSDNMFDAIYEFGAFTTFISNYNVFKELYRVLKPGGSLFISDAVLLDNFNKNNQEHLNLMSTSRMVMAGGTFLHYKYFEDIGIKSGFTLISSKGGEAPNLASELGMLKKEHAHFGKIESIINFLTKCRILPKHMNGLIKRLRYGGEDLVTMEEKNLVTMDWEFHFIKPK